MPESTIRQAISRGLREALDSDERVYIMGEDVGAYGGSYAVTKGFLVDYGPKRIRDTPIAESVMVGCGVGAAMGGLRPVVEIMSINFSLLAMDQIVNHAAKMHFMSGGQFIVPLIIRTVTGGGSGLAATHSQSLEGWYASVPGLKVVVPSTPYDALGLLRTAFLDSNPVMFVEHSLLYKTKGEVPEEFYTVPFGQAAVRRMGMDLTIVAFGQMVNVALEAADRYAERGREVEVIDLRTLSPLDIPTVIESTKKTGRVVVLDEAWQTGSFVTEVAYRIQHEALDYLDGSVVRVAAEDVPAPYALNLERATLPNADRVMRAVEKEYGI
jgi:pyruvate dehydrogenase E1 component beta subunit